MLGYTGQLMQRFDFLILLALASGLLPSCQGGDTKPNKPVASADVAALQARPRQAEPLKTAAAPSATEYTPPPARTAPLGAVGVQGTKDKPQAFGAAITHKELTPFDNILSETKKYADQTVLVEGLVRRACSRKGCWMELAKDETGPGCRVTFKDYGFFVPTDSAGAQARVEAVVKLETLEPNQVRHHEREGATFANKNPDGSAHEVRLVANGVELWH
jgi:hypothetical protein